MTMCAQHVESMPAGIPCTDPTPGLRGSLDTGDLLFEWAEAPWDSRVLGSPVLQVERIEVRGPNADRDMTAFETTRDLAGCGLVSCRLPHERLRESMLLEDRGFRFIEMMYQPIFNMQQGRVDRRDTGLAVMQPEARDLPEVMAIAPSAFCCERFHMDPRLDSRLGDQRYCNWLGSSLGHASQQLRLVREGKLLVAFFIIESLADGTCYWHLNAVAPGLQGRGYGWRAWLTMLQLAQDQGAAQVRTSIAARNHRVLNLYARLGFRFSPPTMTFHWVRQS